MGIKTCEIQCVSLLDQTLNTGLEIMNLIEGEIFTAHFRNPKHFRQYVDIGVIMELRTPYDPSSIIFFKFGSSPFSTMGFIILKVAPSIPITNTFDFSLI